MSENKSKSFDKSTASESNSIGETLPEQLSNLLGRKFDFATSPKNLEKKDITESFYKRLALEGMRHQRNLCGIVNKAFESIDPEVKGDNFSPDWLAKFFLYAREIESSELQEFWSCVLVNEYNQSGSFDFLSLRILSDMSEKDILICEKLTTLMFPEGYIFKLGNENSFAPFGVTKDDIGHAQALGLIFEAYDLNVTFEATDGGLTFVYDGTNLILRHHSLRSFTLPAFKLTSSATQIVRLFDKKNVDENYLRELGKSLKPFGYEYRLRREDGALIK